MRQRGGGVPPGARVLDAGVFTTIQDRGRYGFAHLAVSPSGAADRSALDLANRLVGNRSGAPGLEIVLGGLMLEFDTAGVVAAAGAETTIQVEGSRGIRTRAPVGRAVVVAAGERLRVTTAHTGFRCYLACRGGLAPVRVLGSASTDTLSGLGPPPLAVGDQLSFGEAVERLPAPDQVPTVPVDPEPTLDLVAGPRLGWITNAARRALGSEPFVVSDQSDRIGVRLRGRTLERARTDELDSEALVVGAVQVPPSGEPIIFGPDHPATGGYPVVAVVAERHLGRVAQLRPGQPVRFRWQGGDQR